MADKARKTAEDNSLEKLREGIEQEVRFKTSMRGYDKQAVNEFIAEAAKSHSTEIEELKAECKRLTEENSIFKESLAKLEKTEQDIRSEERRNHQAELDIREGLVDRLRSENERLGEENHRLQLELADLQEKLRENSSRFLRGGDELSSLNGRLFSLLTDKFSEISSLSAAWQKECEETLRSLAGSINTAENAEADRAASD